MISLIFSLALFAADPAAPAPAATETPAQEPSAQQVAAAEKKAATDRVICKKEYVVGSRRPKKMCLTKGQWTEWEDLNKDKLNNQTYQDPTPGVATAQ
jgi:hypothetical protein